jgi:carbamoylphosphate synthase large subunit
VRLALELGVIGLMNVQYAMKDGVVYVLEVNPRASRTIPFVAKATGVPWAQIAVQCAAGKPHPKPRRACGAASAVSIAGKGAVKTAGVEIIGRCCCVRGVSL